MKRAATPPRSASGPGSGAQKGAIVAAGGGVGAAVVAAVAGACCVGPVIAPVFVSVLGASGAAWAAGLKPYSSYLLLGSLLLLGAGFWRAYRGSAKCAADVCRRSPRGVRLVLWIASFLWIAAAAVNVAVRVAA
jgi:hypothetical protein